MRKPVVQVIGQSGRNLVESWGSDLIAVRFTDNERGEADEIEIEFSVSSPFPGPPAAGTRYRLSYGWEGGGAARCWAVHLSERPPDTIARLWLDNDDRRPIG